MEAKASACVFAAVWLVKSCAAFSPQAGNGVIDPASLLQGRQQVGAYGQSSEDDGTAAVAFLQQRIAVMNQQRAAMLNPDASTLARTLQSLDANGNGKIDSSEIVTFATSQGLDPTAAASELATFDTDGDGTLSTQELASVLGMQAAPAEPQQPAPQQLPAAAAAAPASWASAPAALAQPVQPAQPV